MRPSTDPERARALVLAHGRNATAYQVLNPSILHWFDPAGDGLVGYVDAGRTRVAAGDPVGPPERIAEIGAAFERDAARSGSRVCYFATSESFARTARRDHRHASVWIGAQPVWDPAGWADAVAGHRSLRAQLRRAHNKGVRVSEWPAERARDNAQLHAVLEAWLERRPFPTLHFLVEPETLGALDDRRVFVAERDGEPVGFIVASPVPMRAGWLVEQIVRLPAAPNGTAALLVDHAMSRFAEEGARFATLGLAPLSRQAGIPPGHPPWLALVMGWVRAHGERFYHFAGLDFFKAKFRPDAWESIYATTPGGPFSLGALYATGVAFSGGSPWIALARALGRAAGQELRWARRRLVAAT